MTNYKVTEVAAAYTAERFKQEVALTLVAVLAAPALRPALDYMTGTSAERQQKLLNKLEDGAARKFGGFIETIAEAVAHKFGPDVEAAT